MKRDNNCQCAVCHVEQVLLESLRTQQARNHFQAIANNYPVLNHFRSPIDVVEYLHEHGQATTQNPGSEILPILFDAVVERSFQEIGQALLLLAFTPAIHKVCSEISQRFPSLAPEDIAQQASLCLLEAAQSRVIARQNGHLVLALVRTFRKNTFRWAIKEARITTAAEENGAAQLPEQPSEPDPERSYEIDEFLRNCRSSGLLSEADHELLLKFQCEGFEAMELSRGNTWVSAKAVHHRLEKILSRLRRAAADPRLLKQKLTLADPATRKKVRRRGGISPGVCPFSNSEKRFSPELSRPVPQLGADVTHITV